MSRQEKAKELAGAGKELAKAGFSLVDDYQKVITDQERVNSDQERVITNYARKLKEIRRLERLAATAKYEEERMKIRQSLLNMDQKIADTKMARRKLIDDLTSRLEV